MVLQAKGSWKPGVNHGEVGSEARGTLLGEVGWTALKDARAREPPPADLGSTQTWV